MTHRFLLLGSAIALCSGPAFADMNFNRIAAFPVAENMPDAEVTSSEIIAATADGMTLVYTDSPAGVLGFIDITDPAAPVAAGVVELDGEPTSVAVLGQTAFVGVNTSADYVNTSGHLLALDSDSRAPLGDCDLGGQPDSVAVAPDGRFVAVAIENERDEDLGDGRTGQMPAGFVAIVPLAEGALDCAAMIRADVTGLAEVSPEDPEPEFVSINSENEIVVTLQENNHLVILSATGTVLSHFSAGSVDLEGIDTVDDRAALVFDGRQPGRLREPDAVTWIDDSHFATANEGDMDGGSRGWTIFHQDGSVIYDSGASFEHAIVEIGHYPDRRSDAKGVEPESVTFGVFDGTPYVFVGAERASVMGVYDVTDPAQPVLAQLLPSGIGPEGFVVIPERGLLVSANETDLGEDGGARSHVMIYAYQDADAVYPQLTSEGMEDLTGWGAISGMVADPDSGLIYAVNDSFYAMQPTIFVIDPSQRPARIMNTIPVIRGGQPAQMLDMEGITVDGDGGFWVASEGRSDRMVPHGIYHIDADGEIDQSIPLPAELLAVERRFGFEGITMVGNTLWMAVQREWGDDPDNHVKLVAYDTETGDWGAVRYELTEPATGWVGLSDIVAHGDHVYLIERDNQIGTNAVTKIITRVALSDMAPAPLGGDLPVVAHELVVDLIPHLTATGGYVLDKVEGLAILPDGTMWISTDNDGVDDHSGETVFFALPPM